MDTSNILAVLIEERDRLNIAIAALQGNTPRRGRPRKDASIATAPAKKTRSPRTPAQRKAQAEKMKAYWAAKKKAEKKTAAKKTAAA